MARINQNDAPGVYQAMMASQQYVDKSGIDKKQQLLIKFRVSQINSCAYCLDMHFKEAIHAGETAQRLYSLSAWRETSYYTPKERAVLAFAEELTRLPEEKLSEHILDEVTQYYTKEQIANITLAIVMINSWNRIVRAFGPVPGSYKVREAVSAN